MSLDHMSADQHPARRFWPSIVRIAVAQVVVLLALAGIFAAYLNWSSEATFAEFLAVSKAQAAPTVSLQAVKLPCGKDA